MRRSDGFLNGTANLTAHALNLFQEGQPVLDLPALAALRHLRQVRQLPLDTEAAAKDVRHALGAQLTALPAVNRIAAPVMKPGLGNLGGDGRKRLAVRAGSVNRRVCHQVHGWPQDFGHY